MYTVMKWFFGLLIACGFLLMLGVAGADCDGDCMENSLTIAEILEYTLYAIVMMAIGTFGLVKLSEV